MRDTNLSNAIKIYSNSKRNSEDVEVDWTKSNIIGIDKERNSLLLLAKDQDLNNYVFECKLIKRKKLEDSIFATLVTELSFSSVKKAEKIAKAITMKPN